MPFNNQILGGEELVRSAIRSRNFQESPQTGWRITRDGDAFFTNVTVSEGTIVGGTIKTSEGFPRIEISNDEFFAYDENGIARVSIGEGLLGADPLTLINLSAKRPTNTETETGYVAATDTNPVAGNSQRLGIIAAAPSPRLDEGAPRLLMYSTDTDDIDDELLQIENTSAMFIDMADFAQTVVINNLVYGEYQGTALFPIVADWETLTLSGGAADGGSGNSLHRIKRLPTNQARLQLDIDVGAVTSGSTIATVPSWAIPDQIIRMPIANTAGHERSPHLDLINTDNTGPGDELKLFFSGTNPSWLSIHFQYDLS